MNCARCGRPLCEEGKASSSRDLAAAAERGIDLALAGHRGNFADWDLDQQVRRLQVRVGSWRRLDQPDPDVSQPTYAQQPSTTPAQPAIQRRIDTPHDLIGHHAGERPLRTGRSSTLGWCLLWLGLMAFTCGTALLVWSWMESRPDLWSLGVPIAIGGQVGLFMGLVLQLERIWHNSRVTVLQLEQVDAQLRQLERATTDWTAPHTTASQAFRNRAAG